MSKKKKTDKRPILIQTNVSDRPENVEVFSVMQLVLVLSSFFFKHSFILVRNE